MEHHNDIKEVQFFIENPEEGTYLCRHNKSISENFAKIVFTQEIQTWSEWSMWSKWYEKQF